MALQIPFSFRATADLMGYDRRLLAVFPDLSERLAIQYPVAAAYVRVEGYRRRDEGMRAAIAIYANDRRAAVLAREEYEVPYDRTSGNPVAVIYSYLKSLPAYAAAVDV